MQEISQKREEIEKLLKEKLTKYYTDTYNRVGLDPTKRIAWRIDEEQFDADRVEKIEGWMNTEFKPGQKHLIVGTGTGGLAVVLHKKGCDVHGIEPFDEANEIVYLKCELEGMKKENFTKHFAESLPYEDDTFDYLHCYTVLEHVMDVKKSLEEMVRVLKPGGFAHIHTPDYRFPYEPHYKVLMPPFMPKWMASIYIFCIGRPTGFFRHIKFFNAKSLNKILYYLPVDWMRVYSQLPDVQANGVGRRNKVFRFFKLHTEVCKNQEILIRKKERG